MLKGIKRSSTQYVDQQLRKSVLRSLNKKKFEFFVKSVIAFQDFLLAFEIRQSRLLFFQIYGDFKPSIHFEIEQN